MILGLSEVLARLEVAAAAMAGAAAKATTQAVADDAADKARVLAPVLTGALRNSIRAESNGNGAKAIADVDYAAAVEFGSIHGSPQPFFRPALHQAEAELPAKARAIYRSTVPGLT